MVSMGGRAGSETAALLLLLNALASVGDAASRLFNGCTPKRFSMEARIAVVSYCVWST